MKSAVFRKKVVIYTIQHCPHCEELKDFLRKRGIEFEDIDVEENDEAAEEIIEKTGQNGFPVIDIDGEIIIGFDEEKISEALEL